MKLVKTTILLRFVNRTPVALVKQGENVPEMLATRYDLFEYAGGVSWGYKGTGVQHLAHAIAAKYSERETTDAGIIVKRAYALVENLLSRLDGNKEHDLTDADISQAIEAS